jgi:hypothetical protein
LSAGFCLACGVCAVITEEKHQMLKIRMIRRFMRRSLAWVM